MLKIENGYVYELREGNNFTEKLLKCMEHDLLFNIDSEIKDTSRELSGTIYKKHYETGIVPIQNNIEMSLAGYDNTVTLSPSDGMVDFKIDIPLDVKSIRVIEANNINVSGSYQIEEVED